MPQQPRQPMVSTPQESLRTLLRMRPPVTDSYVSRRRAEIHSGVDDLLPEADSPDFHLAQEELGGGFSRDAIRSSALTQLRNKLKMAEDAREHDLRKAAVPHQVQGEFDIRKEIIANQGRERQAQIGADSRVATAEAQAQAREAAANMLLQGAGGNRSVSVSGVGSVGAPPRAGGRNGGEPTDAMLKRLNEAKSAYGGIRSRAARVIGLDGGREQYTSSLKEVLDRKGLAGRANEMVRDARAEGKTAEQWIAEAAANGVDLDIHEQEYLKFMLGGQ